MDIIETVLMFLYKLSKTKLMTKGAKLASAASADALPVFSLKALNIVRNCLKFPKFLVSKSWNPILH